MVNRTTTTPKPATDPAAKARVDGLGEVDTRQPLDQRPNGLVKAAGNGRSRTDIAYGDLIDIVKHAETQVFEGQTTIQLQSELDNARRQEARRELVDVEVIRRIKTLAEGWEVQRGLTSEEGSGS